jgi:hypothetical protein
MKLAWLISGTFKNSTEPIVKLLEWLRAQKEFTEVDVYMHLWWDPSYVGKRHSHRQLSVVEEDPTNEIMEKINPKKLVLSQQEVIDLSEMPFVCGAGGTSRQRETAFFSHLSQMRGIRRCLELVDNIDEYDVIFRMRGDMCMHDETVNFNFVPEMINSNKIWIADGQFFTGWPYGDWAYIGSKDNMVNYIRNVENQFSTLCKTHGLLLHTHEFLDLVFPILGLQIERWFVPLKITRLCNFHNNHLLIDTVTDDEEQDPFYWHLMDGNRLVT